MIKPKARDLQQARLAYPEAAWVASCGNYFPSHVQWVHKYLPKVDTLSKSEIINVLRDFPEMTTSAKVLKSKATVGSGRTLAGELIHEKVSLDWVKWALQRKVWSLLYTSEKINATRDGSDIVVNVVKDVLNVAVEESIFINYSMVSVNLDSVGNNISIKFNAELEHTILSVEVSGSLYY